MKILTQKMLGAQGLATEELWLRSFLPGIRIAETHNLAAQVHRRPSASHRLPARGEHFIARIESVVARPSLWLPQLQRTVCVFAVLGLDEDTYARFHSTPPLYAHCPIAH